MNEHIFETVVTTCAADGSVHIAPMGVRYEADRVVLKPFRPSTTLDNLMASRRAVVNLVDDVRIFAGCVTRTRRDWPVVDVGAAGEPRAVRLAAALAHRLLGLESDDGHPERPTLRLRTLAEGRHAPWRGFNRAQAAVIEGSVLASRLHLLPREKIDAEMRYLQIAIDKTAGEAEHEAWRWLIEAVARHAEGT